MLVIFLGDVLLDRMGKGDVRRLAKGDGQEAVVVQFSYCFLLELNRSALRGDSTYAAIVNVDKVESLGPDNKDYRLCMRQLWLLLARESRGVVAQRCAAAR